MQKYEYCEVNFDFKDLTTLNVLGAAGWKVVSVQKSVSTDGDFVALLERLI